MRMSLWQNIKGVRTGLAVAVACAATPAAAEDGSTMTGLDFMVDWPELVGSTVTIAGGLIAMADADGAFLRVPGGNIRVSGPWADREDLRYLFTHCTSILPPEDRCTMAVTGTVANSRGKPQLTNSDFQIPE